MSGAKRTSHSTPHAKKDEPQNLGPFEPLTSLRDEFPFNQAFGEKVRQLGVEGYCGWRRVRGDGNCYYRAVGVGYLEQIITAPVEQQRRLAASFLTRLERLNFQDSVEAQGHRALLNVVRLLAEGRGWNCSQQLMQSLQDMSKASLDLALVRAVRHLSAQNLQANPDIEIHGITCKELLSAQGLGTPADFCRAVILPMGVEAETLVPNFTAPALDIVLQVVLLDRSDGSSLNLLTYHPDDDASIDRATVHIQIRPGHYDMIYMQNPEAVQPASPEPAPASSFALLGMNIANAIGLGTKEPPHPGRPASASSSATVAVPATSAGAQDAVIADLRRQIRELEQAASSQAAASAESEQRARQSVTRAQEAEAERQALRTRAQQAEAECKSLRQDADDRARSCASAQEAEWQRMRRTLETDVSTWRTRAQQAEAECKSLRQDADDRARRSCASATCAQEAECQRTRRNLEVEVHTWKTRAEQADDELRRLRSRPEPDHQVQHLLQNLEEQRLDFQEDLSDLSTQLLDAAARNKELERQLADQAFAYKSQLQSVPLRAVDLAVAPGSIATRAPPSHAQKGVNRSSGKVVADHKILSGMITKRQPSPAGHAVAAQERRPPSSSGQASPARGRQSSAPAGRAAQSSTRPRSASQSSPSTKPAWNANTSTSSSRRGSATRMI